MNERRIGISDDSVDEPLIDNRENMKIPLEILCKICIYVMTAVIILAIVLFVKVSSK
jgi:hypothetical protein